VAGYQGIGGLGQNGYNSMAMVMLYVNKKSCCNNVEVHGSASCAGKAH
jgi:hypothetical protein